MLPGLRGLRVFLSRVIAVFLLSKWRGDGYSFFASAGAKKIVAMAVVMINAVCTGFTTQS